jgi:hypothetical protein
MRLNDNETLIDKQILIDLLKKAGFETPEAVAAINDRDRRQLLASNRQFVEVLSHIITYHQEYLENDDIEYASERYIRMKELFAPIWEATSEMSASRGATEESDDALKEFLAMPKSEILKLLEGIGEFRPSDEEHGDISNIRLSVTKVTEEECLVDFDNGYGSKATWKGTAEQIWEAIANILIYETWDDGLVVKE